MEQTLNPQQIVSAIRSGKINFARFDGGSMYLKVMYDEGKDFVFKIGEEAYYCRDGKVHVNYDFELSDEDIRLIRRKALQCLRFEHTDAVKLIDSSLDKIESELKQQ